MNTTATTPPIMTAVLEVEEVVAVSVVVSMSGGCVGIVVVLSLLVILLAVVSGGCVVVMEHSPSLRDEMATEHSASTVISTAVTMIVAPPLTQLSSREMRETLSVSELPPSLARNVTCVGDSGKQAKNCSSMMSLLMPHSAHEAVSSSNTALVMSTNFSFFSTLLCRIIIITC